MATNQVIHGSNRVVENPNRYKLNAVSGQANTYDLEKVPGTITDNGTPYNKTILDKIDNVLSYLSPSVEKVVSGYKEAQSTSLFMPTTWSEISSATKYSSTFILEDGETYNVTIECDGLLGTSWPTYYAFDGTYYATSCNVLNDKWINIDFDKEVKITSATLWIARGTVKLEGSNNKISWTQLGAVTVGATSVGDKNLSIANPNFYKYYRLYCYNSSSYVEIAGVRFDSHNYKIPAYQNQFTLDNNPLSGFTNNQRVLVDTNIIVDEFISGSYNLLPIVTGTTSGRIYSGICTDIKNTPFSFTASHDLYGEYYLSNALDGNAGTTAYLYGVQNPYFEFDFNRKIYIKKIKIKARSGNSSSPSNICLYNEYGVILENVRYDNDTIVDLTELNTFSNKLIIKPSNDSITSLSISTMEIIDWEYYYEWLYDTYDVTSNTLNGVDIPTLLQPSTKYELIYKEDTNKFEIGGGNTLIDTTLISNVERVDLPDLSKLDENKFYMLIISNNDYSANQISLYSGSNKFDVTTPSANLSVGITFITRVGNNIAVIYKPYNNSLDSTAKPVGETNYLTISSSVSIKTGTRIIIKEVA